MIKTRHTTLTALEEDLWRQRAKTKWELQGDAGTKYFHAIASGSKRNNMITQIEQDGVLFSDHSTKANAFFDFFKELMGTSPNPMPDIHWSNLYPQQHNLQELGVPITVQEIQEAILKWPNNKSAGPDGFSGEFYKHFLKLLIPDIFQVLNHVVTTGGELRPLNTSYIVLLPKTESPTKPNDFRPISLLHGIQKIFSKILANRLRDHIHYLLLDVQTGFQKGRQMVESYIYAQQVLHHCRVSKTPVALFKLDIRKAFDTINWEFILQTMRQLGFPINWINWIEHAVLQGSSQVIINGLLGKRIVLKRGVRQGDPLSPQLFIIAMDFFARYLQQLNEIGAIQLPYGNMRPCLLYADDALLFFKPDQNQARAIKIALLVFQHVSGLSINLQKSQLLTTHVEEQQGAILGQILGCRLQSFPITYLGIPLSDTRLPRTAYIPLIEKLNKKLGGWAANFLSIAGRLVLLNSILSALPMHYMSVMRLPEWVITEIDRIRRRFLWKGANEQAKGYNLVDWEVVCQPKNIGGLGVLDMKVFNQALLLKWMWMWAKHDHKMWKPLMEATSIIQNGVPVSLLFAQIRDEIMAFFNASVQFIPGNGHGISFWNHNWGFGIPKHILPDIYSYAVDTDISLRAMATAGSFNGKFRPNLSTTAEEELTALTGWISALRLDPLQRDEPKWKWNAHGEFTVQSAYRAMKTGPLEGNCIKRIWQLGAAPRMLVFGWLAQRNRILTHDNLKRRGLVIVSRCTLCKRNEETVKHLLQHCQFTRYVYSLLQLERPSNTWPSYPVFDITDERVTGLLTGMEIRLMLIMQFVVWRERCARVFAENERQPHELTQDIMQELQWSEMKSKNARGVQREGRS